MGYLVTFDLQSEPKLKNRDQGFICWDPRKGKKINTIGHACTDRFDLHDHSSRGVG